jgi:hypothetical protein
VQPVAIVMTRMGALLRYLSTGTDKLI